MNIRSIEKLIRVQFLLLGTGQKASSRVRGLWVIEELERLGVQCEVLSGSQKITIIRSLFLLLSCDVLFLQKGYSRWHFYLAKIAKIFGKGLILDIDDKYSPIDSSTTLKNISRIMRIADFVFAGSPKLVEFAKQYKGNAILVPSCIRLASYLRAQDKADNKSDCVLGWVGNGNYYFKDLVNILTVPLTRLATDGKVKLKIVGACKRKEIYEAFSNIPNLTTEFIDELDWSDQKAVIEAIEAFDVGLYPLSDTDYNAHKCGFKALEYMTLGIPVVASPVGANVSIVQDGVNGYLCNTNEEWSLSLKQLIGDSKLRKKIGQNGRLRVRQNYDVKLAANQIQEVLMSVTKKVY